ncbi:hypothetical protein QBC43DRAFT_289942 [Cladorrhinum sp. PSN259]|nr:hypothetical protein QBC43DRAFT_289942 [Cladorrhinum sp. PSN259]
MSAHSSDPAPVWEGSSSPTAVEDASKIIHHRFAPDQLSPGVRRAEALSAVLTTRDFIFVFLAIFIIAFAYGLDGMLRYAYQPYATASFDKHSLLATVNVLRSVIAAAAQPTAGRIADIFGRVQLVCVSVVLYVIGTLLESEARNVEIFAAGALIYQVGYTMILLLVEVIIADLTSTRARLLFSYIPTTPFLILTWVSGDVSSSVLKVTDWRWGIRMWAIIYPVCALPLIISLVSLGRRANKHPMMAGYKDPIRSLPWRQFLSYLFWRLDLVGIILMIAVFTLILVPMTIAGGFETSWTAPKVLATLIVGVCTIPAFVLWQLYAPQPLVPFRLLKDRGIWAALGIALMLNWARYMQGDYLYSVLIAASDFDITTATRVSSFYTFFSVLTGTVLGLIVYKVRRLKIFIVIGTCLFMVAFGLLIRYRGDAYNYSRAGVIGAQVVLGIAGGIFPYPAQASLQAGLDHGHLAVLPGELSSRLSGFSNETLATFAYGDPFAFSTEYPVGTGGRQALIDSYKHAKRLLTITGICLCVPLIAFAIALRNAKLNDDQTLAKDGQPAVNVGPLDASSNKGEITQ